MIDYIKISLKDRELMLSNLIENKSETKVSGNYNYSEGDFEFPLKSERTNMFIRISNKGGIVENSIHKYYNIHQQRGKQNYDDFSYCEIIEALEILEEELNYPLDETRVNILEFGFNIELDINPTFIINNNILMHNFQSPCIDPKNKKNMVFNKFDYTEYELKIYNKTLEFGLSKNILRIEVKYKSKRLLNKLGIFNLTDLYNKAVYTALLKDYLYRFDKLMFVDTYNGSSKMTEKEKNSFSLLTHPNYWIELRNKVSIDQKHRNTLLYNKTKLKKLINKYNLEVMKGQVLEKILIKFDELYNCSNINFIQHVA